VILNLGCGSRMVADQPAVNVDKRPGPGVNVVHDLNERPWPFEDGQFEKCQAEDILEHLGDLTASMEEIWRVLEPGGLVWIRGPHHLGLNAVADPTHKRAFNEYSFDYLDPNLPIGEKLAYLTERKFRVLQSERDGQDVVFLLRKLELEEYGEPKRDFEIE